jgi:hypothetical protein
VGGGGREVGLATRKRGALPLPLVLGALVPLLACWHGALALLLSLREPACRLVDLAGAGGLFASFSCLLK